MTAALKISNFSKSYDGHLAVDDLSLEIAEGELFGLLGPNGAGKSTTIHAICGINKFHQGSIEVCGYDVLKNPIEAKKLIGLAPQDFNIDMFLSIKAVLMFFGGYYGIPKKERRERVAKVLQMLDLKKHENKKFRQLSGGMKRRVMLARALICDPKLLILDEPTAALDVELRHDLWKQITNLNKAGKTIILTSHYIEEIERLCERVAIINHGKLLFIGHKKELLNQYASLEEAFIQMVRHHDN